MGRCRRKADHGLLGSTRDQCSALALVHDGKMIAAGTDEAKLRTWNAVTGQPLSPVVLYDEEVYGVSFNRDGSQLLVATGPKSIVQPGRSARRNGGRRWSDTSVGCAHGRHA
jgi:WD40 repeat protein